MAYYSLINRIFLVEEGKITENLLDEFPPLLSILEDMIYCEWIELENNSKEEIDIMRFTDDNIPHTR